MAKVCLYFQVHQPYRLKQFSFFDLGKNHEYEDDVLNRQILEKVSGNCYLRANKMLLELIKKSKGDFKVSFSFSGLVLEQFEKWQPEVLKSFQDLVKTGHVEILGETYYHTLSFFYSKEDFREQVAMHRLKIEELFGVRPMVFRNTELCYQNELVKLVADMGFIGALTEGVNFFLHTGHTNQVFMPPGHSKLKLLLRNTGFSDDIAFRFSDKTWYQYPLTAEKFSQWISHASGEVINLFMDYESIGEHQWEDTGIFDFMKNLPVELLKKGIGFATPSQIFESIPAKNFYDVPFPISWADKEKDLSAWQGNTIQKEAMRMAYELEKKVRKKADLKLLHTWRKLTTSDHFYYMSTKGFSDGMVHQYFSPYNTPYDAYINYMNVLSDMELRC
jgi:alpha-amylase